MGRGREAMWEGPREARGRVRKSGEGSGKTPGKGSILHLALVYIMSHYTWPLVRGHYYT